MKPVALIPLLLAVLLPTAFTQTPNLAKGATATASSSLDDYVPARAIDGEISDRSRWVSARGQSGPQWLQITLPNKTRIGGIHLFSGFGAKDPIPNFLIQFQQNGNWIDVPSGRVEGNTKINFSLAFDETINVTTSALRLLVEDPGNDILRVKELKIWPHRPDGIPAIAAADQTGDPDADIPKIYLNQSGFNLGKPKRFTAPLTPDGTPFTIREAAGTRPLFEGTVQGKIGDFSDFNPRSDAEFVVESGDFTSVPFRIGPWWLERVTYQGMIDFMVDSRHYHGTHTKPCVGSFAWRDDHAFGYELNSLVPQLLSNPSAYTRMPRQITYQSPKNGPDGQPLWGVLTPYPEDAPDLVKMIHWAADVIVTQKLEHMLLKEQLAFFLYAWPSLEPWLPRQNYEAVKAYATSVWAKPTIDREYPHDTITEDHNLFRVKTEIGGPKGDNPPGHSVLPNLLMHEVALRDRDPNAGAYFQAAADQVEWMIANLDWNDPKTTKGQRLSEHVTMTGLALMAQLHPDRAPPGLIAKINDWADVMVRRSENLWDFRRLSEDAWVPTDPNSPNHWNEPGNVIGFPASLLAAMPHIKNPATRDRLQQLVWSHFDNAFGRNPTGRHFSYDAPREIEGVEFGWYRYYPGGIGQLADARFVFDGGPKDRHYPYHPEVGDFGWTEGWVNFNTAFNLSMAYLAHADTRIDATWQDGRLTVNLRAPINFDPALPETATVRVRTADGREIPLELSEDAPDSDTLTGRIALPQRPQSVAYGAGYLEHRTNPR